MNTNDLFAKFTQAFIWLIALWAISASVAWITAAAECVSLAPSD